MRFSKRYEIGKTRNSLLVCNPLFCWRNILEDLISETTFSKASVKNVQIISSAKGAARGGAEGAQAPPLAIRILMFIFLVFHQHCKSRSGALQNVLWQYHRRSKTFVIKPSGYEFSRFEKYWSSFFHPCVFCATIYNKSWVLSCSASVETSMTFELPTVSIDV